MLKIGIIVNDLSPSQMSFNLIKSFNELSDKNSLAVDLVVFIKNVSVPCANTGSFSIMNISEIYDYTGILIATDLNTASQIVHLPGPQRKIFYSYDLDWLRRDRSFEALYPIYNNPELELWARSEDHKTLLELTFNCKVKSVVEECNISKLYEILKDDSKKN